MIIWIGAHGVDNKGINGILNVWRNALIHYINISIATSRLNIFGLLTNNIQRLYLVTTGGREPGTSKSRSPPLNQLRQARRHVVEVQVVEQIYLIQKSICKIFHGLKYKFYA